MTPPQNERDRKIAILAAAHAFTEAMEALGIKYATVIYDETLQTEDGMRIYTIGNIPQSLIDWLLDTYSTMRENSEVLDLMHIKFDAAGATPA